MVVLSHDTILGGSRGRPLVHLSLDCISVIEHIACIRHHEQHADFTPQDLACRIKNMETYVRVLLR